MKKRICKDMPDRCKHINVGRLLFLSFLCVTLTACFSLNACAAGVTVWQKAEEIMKDVYNHILAISTIAGIVTAADMRRSLLRITKYGRAPGERPAAHHL